MKTKSPTACGEDQCSKGNISTLPVCTLFNLQKCIVALCAGLCWCLMRGSAWTEVCSVAASVTIAEYLLYSSTVSTWLTGKLKHAKLTREIFFLISCVSLGLQCPRLHSPSFVLMHNLNETLFFREQTTALPSPCEWDWEHSCTSSPKHLTASRHRHSKTVIPHKVLIKLWQLELAISLKWQALIMCEL